MNDNLDPQAYLAMIMAKLEAETPRRRYTPAQISHALMQVPPFARSIFWEVRSGMTYWQIARRHWITPRRAEREFATALFFMARALRLMDWQA